MGSKGLPRRAAAPLSEDPYRAGTEN